MLRGFVESCLPSCQRSSAALLVGNAARFFAPRGNFQTSRLSSALKDFLNDPGET